MRRVRCSFGLLSAVVLALACEAAAQAQEFTLQVGPPIAASPRPGSRERKVSTKAVFVVRPLGCTDAPTLGVSATAEGIEGGVRRSIALALEAMPASGVRVVSRQWDGGVWVVRVVGTCAGRTAGAIVTPDPNGAYRRDGVEYVAGVPTAAQIDRALRALMSGEPSAAPAR